MLTDKIKNNLTEVELHMNIANLKGALLQRSWQSCSLAMAWYTASTVFRILPRSLLYRHSLGRKYGVQ